MRKERNLKSVAIYDRTGEVITLIMGQDNVPPGLEQSAIVVDLSDYERLIRIDLSEALHPKPVTIANIGAVEALVKEVQSLKKAVKENIDFADKKVYDLISTGKTEGIFQIESSGMKSFMKELKPDCIEDIIAGISLYRPGPMDFIPKYIKGKNQNQTKRQHGEF